MTVTPEKNGTFARRTEVAIRTRCGTALVRVVPRWGGGVLRLLRDPAPKRHRARHPVHCIAQTQGVVGRMSRWEAV